MEILFKGVKEFSQNEFEIYKNLFNDLKHSQSPHTLFIGCSDSRVVPGLITKSLPGDLFVIRNIANLVPPYRRSSEFLATTSAIEYAVIILNIENIVICGHSNCGGCRALFASEEDLNKIPHTKKWLELAQPVKDKVQIMREKYKKKDISWIVEQENIVEQMNHLISYPFIVERYQKKKINILGWYYEIGSGTVFNYNAATQRFQKIT